MIPASTMNEQLSTSPSSATDTLLLFAKDREQQKLQKKTAYKDKSEPLTTIERIQPGLVVIRNFLPDSECQNLAATALSMGSEGENGFYTKVAATNKTQDSEAGQEEVLQLNTGDRGRGRIYDAATRFPPHVTAPAQAAVELAQSVDDSMPGQTCTHVLLNMYTTCDGLVWHRDIYEKDGTSDHPVVNLCIGASCTFGYEVDNEEDDEEGEAEQKFLKLHSGDCLVFGGPSRLIKHAVIEVHLDQYPTWMDQKNPVRFSFTYRDSPEVLGREEEFKYFRVKEHLVGQEDYDTTKKDNA